MTSETGKTYNHVFTNHRDLEYIRGHIVSLANINNRFNKDFKTSEEALIRHFHDVRVAKSHETQAEGKDNKEGSIGEKFFRQKIGQQTKIRQ